MSLDANTLFYFSPVTLADVCQLVIEGTLERKLDDDEINRAVDTLTLVLETLVERADAKQGMARDLERISQLPEAGGETAR